MKIAFLSKTEINIRYVTAGLAPHDVTPCRSRFELLRAIPDMDILVLHNQGFAHGTVDEECLRVAKRLRLIQHHGVATDATDTRAAAVLGIPVAIIPGKNSASVAEHAFFLLMALARRMRQAQSLTSMGRMGEVQCVELQGKTLCVVGMGPIGKSLARMAAGFSMRVVVVRKNPMSKDTHGLGIDYVFGTSQLRDALAAADFVVLALPLIDETFNLIGQAEFAAMKPSTMLINVSRGAHVSRAALEEALRDDRIGGFATDVYWTEPADPADVLLQDPRVIYTPHMGGKSYEAIMRSVHSVRANIDRLVRGEALHNVVNA